MKNETLEEAAVRIYPRLINDPYNPQEDDNKEDRDTWINGATWAQERSFSEIDMISFVKYCNDNYWLDKELSTTQAQELLNKWKEEYK